MSAPNGDPTGGVIELRNVAASRQRTPNGARTGAYVVALGGGGVAHRTVGPTLRRAVAAGD